VISLLLGAALIAGAGWRLPGEIERQVWVADVDRAANGLPTPPEALQRAAIELEHIGNENAVARASVDSSRAWMLLAANPSQTAFQRSNLEATRRTAIRALTQAPGDSFTWYRLATAAANTGRLEEAAHAVAMSIRTGPFDFAIMPLRSRAALFLWPHADAADRAAIGVQVLRHWQWEPGSIAEIAYFAGMVPVALAAAEPYPEVRRDIERIVPLLREKYGEPKLNR
jgi:hypothetical protein